MPFAAKIEVEGGLTGIWELSETPDELIDGFRFSENEKLEFGHFSNSRRKVEFIAIRKTLQVLLDNKYEIGYKTDGKPFLKNDRRHLSISHSPELVVVSVSSKNCGIDVENIGRNIDRVAGRFLHPGELKQIENSGEKQFYTMMVWCAKEAIFKCSCRSNIQFKEQIYIDLPCNSEGNVFNGILSLSEIRENYRLWYYLYKNNMIVYCVE